MVSSYLMAGGNSIKNIKSRVVIKFCGDLADQPGSVVV